jgi:hypothetical protein
LSGKSAIEMVGVPIFAAGIGSDKGERALIAPCMRLEAQLFKQGDRADVICIDICDEAGYSQRASMGEQQSQRFRHKPSAPVGRIEQATHLAAVARLAETVQAAGADHLVALPLDNRPLKRLTRLLKPHHARHHLRHHAWGGKAGIGGKLHGQWTAINLEQIGRILRANGAQHNPCAG